MQNKVAFYIKVYNIEFGGKQVSVPARSRHSRSYMKIDFPVPAYSRIFLETTHVGTKMKDSQNRRISVAAL